MQKRYVLLTAAKNEETHIGDAIQSVLRQTVRPFAWFIMDDGSSDRTASIVQQFATEHPFIRICSANSREGRNFGSQYKALQAAYELAKPLEFEFLGVQDADIAFERNEYYEDILDEFVRKSRLGIAGGYVYERVDGNWRSRPSNSEDSVAGGIQMFRRSCFEEIGGYKPLYYGGSDTLAQIEAQMAGWEIMTRPDHHVFHYRPTSSAGGLVRGIFRAGMEDASFGSHPVFEFLKCCRRATNKPFILGSFIRWCGYVWWNTSGKKPVIHPDKVAFLRNYQLGKLRRFVPSFGKSCCG